MIKRIGVVLIVLLFIPLGIFSACSRSGTSKDIIVSGFAQLDWVREILGDNPSGLEVGYLLDNGVDMHNFQPSVRDIAAISTCKLFVYTDSDSESWISGALSNPKNKERKTLSLMSLLSNEEKLAVIEDGHTHDENCQHGFDEHVWLSLKLAQKFVHAIAERICDIDAENAQIYRDNAQNLIDRIDALDTDFEQILSEKTTKKLLFADRYPFAYLMRDYDIEVAAAFSGCAADTEISVQTITELKSYLTTNDLKYVLILENSQTGIANQIIDRTTAKIKTLNSMQSINKNQLSLTYLSIMESNLNVLDSALA